LRSDATPAATTLADGSCAVTICLAGALTRGDGANPTLERLCDTLPGIHKECSEDRCYSIFSMFQKPQVVATLLGALDSDRNGVVDDSDRACTVSLVGYSWGGVNAIEVASEIATHPKFTGKRQQIDRVVLVDPFAPHAVPTLEISANVVKLWEYRHSVAPADDCSNEAPLGPYLGLPPLCSEGSRCQDYDYSQHPDTTFSGQRGEFRGSDVGHCNIVAHVAPAIRRNIASGEDGKAVPPPVTK